MKYVVTLDIGTTSVKTGVFDERLRLRAMDIKEYELLTPGNDIVELDPEAYWNAAVNGIKSVLRAAGADPGSVAVISVTSQGETLIPVDNLGKPLRNAIVWFDARAAREAEFLSSAIDPDTVYGHTGLAEIGPSTPVAKVLWFKNHCRGLYERTHKFLLVLDFLVNRLTGRFVTDNSVASSTGYVDINRDALWGEMLDAAEINPSLFPEILPCGSLAGRLTGEAAEALGLTEDAAVCMGGMDQLSSVIGAGNITHGIISETTGTALVIGTTVDKPDYGGKSKPYITRHYGSRYLLLPYCPNAAILLKWFKDGFCQKEAEESARRGVPVYALLDEMAERVAPSAGGIVILPHFSGMLTPDVNPEAKGAVFGLGLDTKKEHMIRALLESVAYMLRENIETLEEAGIAAGQIRSMGGGSKSRLWNTIKADVCGKEIVTMEQEETTSLGAAILGAVAAGIHRSVEEACGSAVRIKGCFSPGAGNRELYQGFYMIYKSLYSALKPLYHELKTAAGNPDPTGSRS